MTEPSRDLTSLLDALEDVLVGPARAAIVDAMTGRGRFDDRLRRLRAAMSEHRFGAGERRVDLARQVRRLDVRTRRDGFRVLHSWDHRTHQFSDDVVPALLIDFLRRAGPEDADERVTLEILLDYYFLHLLALCAMRVWDADDPEGAMGRLARLLAALQGGDGSGHRFVADAETLLIYALSQFHPEERAYDRIIERVDTLSGGRRLAFARASAAVLSGHLRWGFWLMYGRDVVRMREDNVGDYPWLLWSVLTLLRAWTGVLAVDEAEGTDEAERADEAEGTDDILESLLQGLAADPWAFAGSVPAAFAEHEEWHHEARELLGAHASALLEGLDRHRPTKTSYAPLALHFNFPHNALVAIVTLALLESRPQPLSLNALFTGALDDPPEGETRENLARALMAFSAGSPDRLGYRGAMLVAYDPLSAMRSFSMTTKALRESYG